MNKQNAESLAKIIALLARAEAKTAISEAWDNAEGAVHNAKIASEIEAELATVLQVTEQPHV